MAEELTREQLTAQVKRINQRYKDLVQTFGERDEMVQRYQSMMNKISTVGTTTPTTKRGGKTLKETKSYTAIKSPSKLNEEDIKIIQKLDKKQTKGERMKQRRKLYKDIYGTNPTAEQLKEFNYSATEIHDFIQTHAQFIYNASESLTTALHRSSNLTADEVRQMLELMEKGKQTGYDVGEIAKEEYLEVGSDYDNLLPEEWS